jgi:hypothetical protein
VLQYAVKIDHVWEQAVGEKVYRYSTPSLGTLVGPASVLTHNHYPVAPVGAWAEALQITPLGQATVTAPLAELAVEAVNAETNRVALDGRPALIAAPAPVAGDDTLAALAAGDVLTVVYWDDAEGALAQGDYAVVAVERGVLTLADPGKVINGGDSGGGAFYRGELVGNTLSVVLDLQRQPVGLFNVALVAPARLAVASAN